MVLTEFLTNIQNNPNLLSEIAGQGTGVKSLVGTNEFIESGESTQKIIDTNRGLEFLNSLPTVNTAAINQTNETIKNFAAQVSEAFGSIGTNFNNTVAQQGQQQQPETQNTGGSFVDDFKSKFDSFGIPSNVAILGGLAIVGLLLLRK